MHVAMTMDRQTAPMPKSVSGSAMCSFEKERKTAGAVHVENCWCCSLTSLDFHRRETAITYQPMQWRCTFATVSNSAQRAFARFCKSAGWHWLYKELQINCLVRTGRIHFPFAMSKKRTIASFWEQLEGEMKDGNVRGPPISRGILYPDDGSTRRALGDTTEPSKRLKTDHPFRGLPGAPGLNSMALFQPQAMSFPKPSQFSFIHELDAKGRVTDWGANNPLVVYKNAKMVGTDWTFTTRCLPKNQLLFLHHAGTDFLAPGNSIHPDTILDEKMCSLPVLNMFIWLGSGADAQANETYGTTRCHDISHGSKPSSTCDNHKACLTYHCTDIITAWRPWAGSINVQYSTNERSIKMPVVTGVVSGPVKMRNLWAGCHPPVRPMAALWVCAALRPKGEDKDHGSNANHVTDLLTQLSALSLSHGETDVLQRISQLRRDITTYEKKLQAEGYAWRFEPAVVYGNEQPPSCLWSGPNWEGYPIRIGFAMTGAGGFRPPEAFRVQATHALYPTSMDSLQTSEKFMAQLEIIEVCINPI